MKTAIPSLLALIWVSACTPSAPAPEEKSPAAPPTTEAPGIRDVDLAEAKRLVDEESDLVILDVRTAEEFADGHLEGATNVDYLVAEEDFRKNLEGINRTAPILMHCQSGGRSAHVAEIMQEMGFEDVAHLNAGFAGWKDAGHPVKIP
ncbi:MAG: rhodanese-like domain-containing protein [Verrucomicrobiota bacterium]